jgi:hypothetical protein
MVYFNDSISHSYYYNVSDYVYPVFYNGHIDIVPWNSPPETPQPPQGPTEGIVGIEYTYTTDLVIDPEGDEVEYLFDWGDGNTSDWSPLPQASYTWNSPDIYEVSVKARDIPFGEESNWSSPLLVTIADVQPELLLGPIQGGFGVRSSISNNGTGNASDIYWNITLDGGLIIVGWETTGTIPLLAVGEEIEIQSNLILGFGRPLIRVAAECQEGASVSTSAEGMVVLFFVIGVS